ncbi:cytoskeleton-associated protein 2 isoform X2 [Oxyura jamaicensis]|uniref:cytoskeleton-associated protein 2 isoform X2 n=1 Tax=Oxyura jamaicensis TaxID=8884 RepID=UPI0015A5A6D1|nr:cytoskeleton-associated protein 2 isoform X2 [Oxyura jamaicensis]
MAARLPPSRRAEPAFREQRRQKVEEYLSRKKTFSGVPIQENEAPISSSGTRRAASNKLQDKNLSASPKPEMEDKENANQLSWDQSSTTSEENVILKSSMITLASGTSYNAEDLTSKDKVTEIKSQHVTLSKSFLYIKSIKEKQLIAEKQNLNVSLTKKPVLGTYRGKVIQSKINSFRKAPKSEGEKNSLPDKKTVTSTTKPAVKSLSTSRCNVVLKTIKVTNHPNSVKPNAVVPKKGTIQNMMGRRGPQPLKAASNNSDHGVVGVKKPVDFCQDAKPGAQAKAVSVVPSMKTGQDSKTMGSRKSVLLKESAEERRIRLAEWRASRGKVMKRPPISVLLETRPKSEEQDFSSAASSLDLVLHSEKVNKTLAECLQLTEQGYEGDKVRAMLQDLIQSTPGAKKLAKYWICWMHLERRGPPEKLFAVYEEAILAGAMPKDELRHMLIDIMKNTESLIKSEDGSAVIESHLEEAEEESKIEPQREAEEVSKEPNSSLEQVQETFKSLSSDQKAEGDDKKAATGNEVIKKEEIEEEIDLKPDGEILPKKNKKHKAKERTKNKGKRETEEQSEDGVKDLAQAVNSPEKNDTTYITRYNPSTTPYLESVKMYHEANDSTAKDLKIVTPLRYSLRIREKMSKSSDTPKDSCVSSFEELESKATALLHKQNNELKEATAEMEE